MIVRLTLHSAGGGRAFLRYLAPTPTDHRWSFDRPGSCYTSVEVGRGWAVAWECSAVVSCCLNTGVRRSSRRQGKSRCMSDLEQNSLSSLLDFGWRTAFRLGFPLARIWWRLTH